MTPPKPGYTLHYGIWFPPVEGKPMPEIAVHQSMFLGRHGEHKARGYLGQKEHFQRFISLCMAHPNCDQPFEWNPNAEQILEDYFAWKWTSFVGHGSSSKSRTIAAIAVGEFLMDPVNTSCLLTSTNIPDGKRRIWADVERCWNDACTYFGGEQFMPGELVSSIATIRYVNRATGQAGNARGLCLIPSKESESEAGIGRMKGFKAPRLRLFLDEASDISIKIVEAAESNLMTGCDDFKCCATLNANSIFDTGGVLCEPKDGWESVNVTQEDCWESKRGWCRRFDGEKSPNVVLARAGHLLSHEKKWKGLISLELLEERRAHMGDDSPNFLRQYRAIWPTGGVSDCIFSLDEIRKHGGTRKAVRKELVATSWGLDPSFAHDGDRCPLVGFDLIRDEEGKLVAEWRSTEFLDDRLDPKRDKKLQIRDNFINRATDSTSFINPKHFGMDTTGGGDVMGTLIAEKWPGASEMLRATFNARASDKPVSALDRRKGHERFANLMSEMWYSMKELLLSGQLKNLPESLQKQFVSRNYSETGGRIIIEDKKSMKKRLGVSPDEADAAAICVHVMRVRLGLSAASKVAKKDKDAMRKDGFDFSPLMKKSESGLRGIRRFNNLSNY